MSEPRFVRLRGATGAIRMAKHRGADRLVVPVVALTEGVIFPLGAKHPEFVSAAVLRRALAGWNNRPVMNDHPMEGKVPVSANTPERLEAASYGEVFNVAMVGNKLVMEEWLDPVRAASMTEAARTIAALQAGQTTEVSVGVQVLADEVPGVHNGISYGGSWLEIVPDHLANLPAGALGACSVAMGCGTLRSARITDTGYEEVAPMAEEDTIKKRTLRQRLTDMFPHRAAVKGWNQSEIRSQIRDALKGVEPLYNYIEDIWESDGYVIYSCYAAPPGGMLSFTPGSSYPNDPYTTVLYRRSFSMTKEGAVTLGERQEVESEVTFVPVAAEARAASCSCGGHKPATLTSATTEGDTMHDAARITALMGNPHNPLKDQKALETASDEALKALEAHCEQAATLKAAADALAETERKAAADKKTADDAAAAARAAQTAPATLTEEQFMAAAPTHVKDMIARFTAAETAQKEALVAKLKAAQKVYGEEKLKTMGVEQLTELATLVGVDAAPAPVDFSGARAAGAGDTKQSYAPPDPYAAALAATK